MNEVADGCIITGEQAKQIGLVDDIGNYYDAVDKARILAGIEGKTNIEIINADPVWWQLLANVKSIITTKSQIRLQY